MTDEDVSVAPVSPPPYDFWLLDLDGTVVDVEPAYVRSAFDRVGDRLGRSFSDREAETLWHGLGGPRNEQLRAWGIDVADFWEAFHAVEDPSARATATVLYDDAADFLARLDAPVGIVTHCQRYLTEPVLSGVGLADRFDSVVCCTGDVGWKPDPAPVERAMAELGVGDRETGVLVGDGPHDVGAAWNAGLSGVHVERHGPERRGHCVRADRRVAGLDEL